MYQCLFHLFFSTYSQHVRAKKKNKIGPYRTQSGADQVIASELPGQGLCCEGCGRLGSKNWRQYRAGRWFRAAAQGSARQCASVFYSSSARRTWRSDAAGFDCAASLVPHRIAVVAQHIGYPAVATNVPSGTRSPKGRMRSGC